MGWGGVGGRRYEEGAVTGEESGMRGGQSMKVATPHPPLPPCPLKGKLLRAVVCKSCGRISHAGRLPLDAASTVLPAPVDAQHALIFAC